MSSPMDNKEAFRKAIREQIAKEIAPYVFETYPNASFLYYDPHVEYSDQDDDYYSQMVMIEDEEHNQLFDIYEVSYSEEQYGKIVAFIEGLPIDNRDFAFAYGFGATIDLRSYK